MKTEAITSAILVKMYGIDKRRKKFMFHLLGLILRLGGRLNFCNLSRYSDHGEQYYRQNFGRSFPFDKFNRLLVKAHCGSELAIAFDPSFISKSGKHTPGIGYFWSGCAQAVKRGLEICGTAVLDIENHTAFHYKAVQTMDIKAAKTPLDYYAGVIRESREDLQKISKTMIFDAFFSKKPFVDMIVGMGFAMVSRMQHNSYLRYRYTGPQKGGRGRPKGYGGRIDPKKVCTKHFSVISKTDEEVVYEGEAHIRSLGRWARVVILNTLKDGKVDKAFIYFSTDDSMSGAKVFEYYRMRFQIEFLYRDGKQHLGLTHCQSRDKEALAYHFDAVLTTLNVAKVAHWLSVPKENRQAFSIADIKRRYANQFLLDRIISILGKDPNEEKNNPLVRELYNLGSYAA